MLLAIPSVAIGFLTEGPMIFGGFFRDSITVLLDRHPAMSQLAMDWEGPVAFALHAFTGPVVWLRLRRRRARLVLLPEAACHPGRDPQRFSGVYRCSDNKYYMDWFNEHVLARGALPAPACEGRRRRHHRRSSSTLHRGIGSNRRLTRAAERLSLLVYACS
jgi:NADH-quinone oxidoreductase subunit L